jgi:hypothetical protein
MKKLNVAGLGMAALLTLGGSLVVGCVDEPKPKAKPAAKAPAKNLVLDAAPPDITKVNLEFEDKVTLLGYKLENNKGPLKAGDKITYTLYWKLNKPLDKGWDLYTHVFDDGKKRLLNIDKVGDLRRSNLPPSKWKPGKVYVDRQSFKVPKNVTGDTIRIVAGLWHKKGTLKFTKGPDFRKKPLALSISLSKGTAQAAPPSWRAPHLRVDKLPAGNRILVDGKLNEPAWANAPKIGQFVNITTGKKDGKSPIQSSAKLLWDEKALYVAFEVTDKDLVSGFKKSDVDAQLWTKDAVGLFFDPNGDNRDYYEIWVGPQNAVFDSKHESYFEPKPDGTGPFGDQSWSSKVTSAVVVQGTLDKPGDEDQGYTVELSIPWTSFDKSKTKGPELGETWRVNLYAVQDGVTVGWSPTLNKGSLHKVSQFGKVLFAEKDWKPAPRTAAAPSVTSVTSALNTAPTPNVAPTPNAAPAASATAKPATPAPAVSAPKPAVPATVAPKPAAPAAP